MNPKPISVIPPPPSSSDDDEETESGSETESDVDNNKQNDAADEQNDEGDKQNDSAGESTEEEEEETDDDDEEEGEKESSPSKKLAAPETPKKSDDDSDNDSKDSESTELSPSLSAFTIKHHSKRPAESESVGPVIKKCKANETDEVKKGATVRRWREDDEIVLLNGMIEYKEEKGEDPYSNMGAFYDYIKDSVSGELLKSQLIEKLRRLKKKYMTNVEKGTDVFSYSHDEKVFELSKKVWGSEESKSKNKNVGKVNVGEVGGVTLALLSSKAMNEFSSKKAFRGVKINSEGKAKGKMSVGGKGGEVESEKRVVRVAKEDKGGNLVDVLRNYPCLSESIETESGLSNEVKEMMRERLGTIEKGKLKELDGKWNKLKEAELELIVKKTELAREQVKLALDLIKVDEA